MGELIVIVGPAIMANPRMYGSLRWSEKSFVPAGAKLETARLPRGTK